MSGLEQTVDGALRQWAAWMRGPSEIRELGYPSEAAGFATGGISCYDDLDESVLSIQVHGVDVIIAELPVLERSAVHHTYLCCVFRAREGVLEQALANAIQVIGRKMVARGLA